MQWSWNQQQPIELEARSLNQLFTPLNNSELKPQDLYSQDFHCQDLSNQDFATQDFSNKNLRQEFWLIEIFSSSTDK